MQILGTFPFYGPNWHTDFAAREWVIALTSEESEVLREEGESFSGHLFTSLADWGIQPENLPRLSRPLPENAQARLAFLFNSTAIALQRHAGHRVYRAKRVASKEFRLVRAIFEVEDAAAGEVAGRLAMHLLSVAIPQLKFHAENLSEADLPAVLVEKFRKKFSKKAMAADTWAMVRAAERAGIPWLRLDQPPFKSWGKPTGNRRDGNLLLGQGMHRHIIDGTLCLDRKGSKARPFLQDRVNIGRLLVRFGAALPHDGREPPVANGLLEALEITERLGYPVVLKPVKRAAHAGVTLDVRTIGDLMQAVSNAQSVSRAFVIQRQVKGPTWRIIVSNGKAVGVLRDKLSLNEKGKAASSIIELAQNLADKLQVGLLVLTVVTPDISRPLEVTGGAVVDVDLAPELDKVLEPGSQLWKTVMDGYIQSLYPPGVPSHIPIIAVTGADSGVTARMIDAIMRQAGFHSALSCSEGFYLGGERLRRNRNLARLRESHHRLIRNRKAEVGVMEFRLDQLKNTGFPFDWCDIGVMTGGTANEAHSRWETPGQIAEILGSVPRRARDGVVLNADDTHTPGILRHVRAGKVILTSARLSALEIRAESSPASGFVTIERATKGDRIVLSEEDNRFDLMGLDEIPAGPTSATEFTLDCTLQAIAAGHLMQVPHSLIRAAISAFE